MSNTSSEQNSGPRSTEREADPSDPSHTRTGAVGGDDSPAADTPIGLPADDDSPLGDSDQHSSAATRPGHPHR